MSIVLYIFIVLITLFVSYIDKSIATLYNQSMTDLTNKLTEIGLNEKQAHIYNALLSLGAASPAQIAMEAKIKRPTTYIVLESLVKQGLIDQSPKGKTTFYSISDPKLLIDSIQNKAQTAQILLPLMIAAFGKNRNQPLVRLYEGSQGVFAVNKLWRQKAMQKDSPKQIWWFGSVADLQSQFKGLLDQNYRVWNEYNIEVRELIGSTHYERDFAQKHQSKTRQFRHIPSQYKLTFDFGIYENQVAIFQLKERPFALLIESVDIADSFRILFDLAWKGTSIDKV